MPTYHIGQPNKHNFCYLLRHYFCCSYFVTLYVKYVFIFQPDTVECISACRLRWSTFAWKVILTFFGILMSIWFPLEDMPVAFKFLTKGLGQKYIRFDHLSMLIKNIFSFLFNFQILADLKSLVP